MKKTRSILVGALVLAPAGCGGGKAPNNAENKPGEHFVWTARYFRGALLLVPMQPTDLTAQTWHRTGAAPSVTALTPGCRPPANALSG